MTAERITVNLTSRAAQDLKALIESEELAKTTIVNRAISLYAVVADRVAQGQQLAFVDGENVQRVVLL